jgi:hypothetical protein
MAVTEESRRAGYLNEGIFCALLLIFTLWRSSKVSKTKMSSYKWRLRFLGSFFIIGSVLGTFIYSSLVWFLSRHMSIDKYVFETKGFMNGNYDIYLYTYKINLVELLNVTYMTSKLLRMSAIFTLIGLWGPCIYSFINEGDSIESTSGLGQLNGRGFISKDLFQTSIVTFSKIYSILRIPGLILIFYKLRNLDSDKLVFFESFFLGGEIYLCIGLLLVLRTKHSFLSGYKGMDTFSLMGLCLFTFAFLNYSINTVSFPFMIDDVTYQIRQSLVFALKLIIDILVVSMICPLTGQIFDEVETKKEKEVEISYASNQVVLYQ